MNSYLINIATMKKKKICLVTFLILCFHTDHATINSADYKFRPWNVVANLGEDIILRCQPTDIDDLSWGIKGTFYHPWDENLPKNYSILSDGSLLIKSVGEENVGLYDCHLTKSLIHLYAYVGLLISKPTCHFNENETDAVYCSVVHAGVADVWLELYNSQGRSVIASQKKSELNRTDLIFKGDMKLGDDSLLYTLNVSFVYECSHHFEELECYPFEPYFYNTFHVSELSGRSIKPTILPGIYDFNSLVDLNTFVTYCAINSSINLFLMLAVLCLTYYLAWRYINLKLNPPASLEAAVPQRSSIPIPPLDSRYPVEAVREDKNSGCEMEVTRESEPVPVSNEADEEALGSTEMAPLNPAERSISIDLATTRVAFTK